MKLMLLSLQVMFASSLLIGSVGVAAPECLGNDGSDLPVNDNQVLQWKSSTPNNFHSRGHILGTLVRAYPDQTGHHHLEVSIGSDSNANIEIVYNEDFGSTPNYQPGAQIEACGDYITAYAQSGGYPPSPDGALIHWVHESDNPQKHPSGFLLIDGVLCGDSPGNNTKMTTK
jgi:hypothetical protein